MNEEANKITGAKVAGACCIMRLVLSRFQSIQSGAYRHFAQFCRSALNAQDSPEARANLETIESKLAELDALFLQFCSQHDYRFSRSLNMFPKRRVWRRQEIDRCMELEMDIGFQDALDRGFYPELPWSLYACGSLHKGVSPGLGVKVGDG